MKVELLNYTPNPELTIALSGRLCYSKVGIEELKEQLDEAYIKRMIKQLVESGHHSTLEHVSFTFGVEGVSRVLTHQLVRHRIGASYSQKSQRYVKEGQFEYIIPKSFEEKGMSEKFKERMKVVQEWYNEAIEAGIKAEDARFYLPNATETKIIVTMNARELIHFFDHRLCQRAQWEIRAMADEMLEKVKEIAPNLFKNVGPGCVNGPCPEGKFTCGKMNEMRAKYREGNING
ncbi:FAD-dependent thymidylate synthase [Haliovirga abyssi]|uniref:Flavin-dependent thymidylate synthase n=1 Tax=Haliovirga abyssi TaxID=2996794 RepID=A0AAU9DT15_9FUSO|nr:FAD-dependent thymidylate synthase [Haliovirga abyssi]BDU50244.1 flavin-dependent thymidylate synthase [Haliovirga abyssi]